MIVGDDLPALVDLLVRGFPRRPRAYWELGLKRMARRGGLPPGEARFGYLLESEGRPVGVLLMLFRREGARLRCNLSSWYVEPTYRLHAPALVAPTLGRPELTLVNLSAAPHTWPTIEAQGFRLLSESLGLVLPSLARRRGRVSTLDAAAARSLPEATLIKDHLDFGCLAVLAEGAIRDEPFLFLPRRLWSGRVALPVVDLVYCRDIEIFRDWAPALGGVLARQGFVGIVVGSARVGMAGALNLPARRTYARGPFPPRTGDIAYTERAIFGS